MTTDNAVQILYLKAYSYDRVPVATSLEGSDDTDHPTREANVNLKSGVARIKAQYTERCIQCGACIEACPYHESGAIGSGDSVELNDHRLPGRIELFTDDGVDVVGEAGEKPAVNEERRRGLNAGTRGFGDIGSHGIACRIVL